MPQKTTFFEGRLGYIVSPQVRLKSTLIAVLLLMDMLSLQAQFDRYQRNICEAARSLNCQEDGDNSRK